MSWNFLSIGKGEAVARAARAYGENGNRCAEPEESVRRNTLELAAQAALGQGENTIVQVECSGSMYTNNGVPITQNLRLDVRPIGNFVE